MKWSDFSKEIIYLLLMMRTKKAIINLIISAVTFTLNFIPVFVVRKIFLVNLGSELLGLSSLYTNIISYLSIIEMGIGTAIIFALYKPFYENDKKKIIAYLSYYKQFYRIIGILILILGLFLLPFITVFIKEEIDIVQAQFYFILFLLNTVISYFFTYKLCILNVDQKNYIINIGTTITKVIISIIQIIIILVTKSFTLYILAQIIVNLIYYLYINYYINKNYIWINKLNGSIDNKEKASLTKNVKALFIHKIGSIVVNATDNLIISSFLNLSIVTKYNNYYLLISAAQGLFSTAMGAITPTIGNLLVDKDSKSVYQIHKQLFFINFWVASFICISLYNTLTQFIILWLGYSQKLDNITIGIIIFNLYFLLMRSSVEAFKSGSGNYHQDRYASLVEAIINLTVSIVLVKYIGLPGVFLGTLASNVLVVFWVKPLITYKYVFNESLYKYFKSYINYTLIGVIPLVSTILITKELKYADSIFMFIINILINVLIINLIYILIFWKNKEFVSLKSRLINMIIKC